MGGMPSFRTGETCCQGNNTHAEASLNARGRRTASAVAIEKEQHHPLRPNAAIEKEKV